MFQFLSKVTNGDKALYCANVNYLVALTTNLGYSNCNMKSSSELANVIEMSIEHTEDILNNFKSIFRKSKYKNELNENFYQLQVSYAKSNEDKLIVSDINNVESRTINSLIDFIVKTSDQELRTSLAHFTSFMSCVISISVTILAIWLHKA